MYYLCELDDEGVDVDARPHAAATAASCAACCKLAASTGFAPAAATTSAAASTTKADRAAVSTFGIGMILSLSFLPFAFFFLFHVASF